MTTPIDDVVSTLIRRARRATSVSDMVEFAKTIHEQPLAALFEELPQIARLSDTKFHLATNILKTRLRAQSSSDQNELRRMGFEIADRTTSKWVGDRIRSIFEFDAS